MGRELVLLYNDAWVPILGPEKHPALGLPGVRVWPEMWHIIGRQLESVLATGQATFSDDQLLPAKRFGYLEEAYFTYSYSAIHDESGAVGGAFTAVTETTQRVLGERRLRTLRALGEVTTAPSGNEERSVEHVCAAALRALAGNRADIPFAAAYVVEDGVVRLFDSVGLREAGQVLPLVVSDPAEEPWVWDAVMHGAAGVIDDWGRRWPGAVVAGANPVGDADPEVVLVLPVTTGSQSGPAAVLVAGVTPYRTLDDDFRGFFGLVVDQVSRAVSDVQAFEGQRRRAEALAELDRAKSEFFANVSHEFRTPLTLIAGPAEDSLGDTREPLGPAQRERVEIIRRNVGRLRRLVDDMLDFARIEAGRMRPELEAADLAELTRELVSSFAPAVARAGLQLRTDIKLPGPPVEVDVRMWEKIVLNLLSNAVKYTRTGHIEVTLRRRDATVALAVRDTGIGIPRHELPLLFQRFHRVRGNSGRSHEGAGIGLALVAELVRVHGGTVEVESTVGTGTTFTVGVPLTPTDKAGDASSTRARPSAPGPYVEEALQWVAQPGPGQVGIEEYGADVPVGVARSGACVLVVEDNADLRRFITRLLAPHEAAPGCRLARRAPPRAVTRAALPTASLP
ncbi:HAMP domain-containing sensor histidine kinase [Amycolatopsis sp. CA-128772]|uniref:sensor histidine kinase n=1 Tax=Amycolatopsis sp. CA-128772 TaxID=2073159 RepID=UPI000CCFEB09|nr:HAMP domain-containing sensor histidine kinase [Amycolatopsis sp. CA-128772]